MIYLKWQQEIIDKEKEMTNRELFDAVIDLAASSWDMMTHKEANRVDWEFNYLKDALENRLLVWFSSI